MLDPPAQTGKSGPVSLPDENVVARGRAIFEQLRATPPERVAGDGAGEHEHSDGAAAPAGAGDSVQDGPDLPVDQSAGPDAAPETSPGASDGPTSHDVGEASDAGTEGPEAAVPGAADTSSAAPAAPEASSTAAVAESSPAARPTDIAPTDTVAEPENPVGGERAEPAVGATTTVDGPPTVAPVETEAVPPRPERGPVPLGIPPEAVATLLGPSGDAADYSPARFARPLPRVMAIANQKGGVGKTTTAVNLGAGFAELGHRVLVVDLDPQGNATTGLGVNPRNLETSIYDVMMHDVPLDDCIEPTALRNLFVCPATIDLAGAEIELVPAFSRELKLRRALEQVLEDFDFVVIDCPPSLGLITVNALAAASEVVVPIQCEYYALEGLGQLLRNVKLVQTNLNPRLEVSAIVLTMFDARTKLADQVATEVRNHFGPKVCRNIVPRTVRLSEAPSFGQPILVFDPTSRGAIAYRELAKEVSGGAPQRVG
jgi:chromosome partitioning protein